MFSYNNFLLCYNSPIYIIWT